MRPPTLGVLGGMGPAATAEFYRLVIEATAAERDQEHIRVIIDADPTIPDRGAALTANGADPRPKLVAAARRLELVGAGVIAMPCNTAHAYRAEIAAAVGIPLLDMVYETAAAARWRAGPAARVGVLATRAALTTGLYPAALDAQSLDPIAPSETGQEQVMEAIRHVKAGRTTLAGKVLWTVAADMFARGCELLVLGCSELPLAARETTLPLPTVDSLATLARAAVQYVGAPVRVPT